MNSHLPPYSKKPNAAIIDTAGKKIIIISDKISTADQMEEAIPKMYDMYI